MKLKTLTSLLGLSLESGHITAVALRRSGRRLRVRQVLQATLSLDPMANEPELAGREIRNRLSEASMRESRCVVCVPLRWGLTLQTDLPELAEEDVQSYLEVQAEREFPFAPEDLSISVSRFRTPSGRKGATVAAIPRNHLTALLNSLKAAKLRPIGITFAVAALAGQDSSSDGVVTLLVERGNVDFAVSIGGGIVALRSLDGRADASEDGVALDAEYVVRQIRITFGRLPQEIRERVRTVRVFGDADLAEALLSEFERSADRLGLSVEEGKTDSSILESSPGMLAKVSPGVVAATAERLSGRAADLEFLPPRTSRFKQITGRVSSRATRWLVAAAAALVVGLGGAFVHQSWKLSRLEAQWKSIEPEVSEIAAVQEKIRRFRAWFDDSPRDLLIARQITKAFPPEGTVWAESLEIRETQDSGLPLVSCSGKARSNREWLAMLERLREMKGVENLRFKQVRGKDPLQFTLSFRWNAGEADGV